MPASASIVRTISIKRHDHASQRQHCGCSIGNAAQATPVESGTGPLAELVAYTASQAPRDGTGGTLNDAAWRRAFPLESSAIDYFRATWSKVSTNRQLRQSQARVPGNAGPLNSSNLVHRSLSMMHELSPGYLHHFLSYVDALSWMEQMSNGVAAKECLRAASTKKSPRGRR